VQKDSIVRGSGNVRFNLVQDTLILPVVYEGRDPLRTLLRMARRPLPAPYR